MWRHRTSVWLVAMIGAGLAVGCESSMGRHCWSDDPLVQIKKPVNNPEEGGGPVFIVQAQPPAPSPAPLTNMPADQLATPSKTTDGSRLASTSPAAKPFHLIDTARQPLPVQSASRVAPGNDGAGLVRQAPGIYGHAPDYAWLQGVLDRHYHGHFELRYCDPASEEQWGGKVCLQDDPRLRSYRDGDEVVVRGTIETENPPLKDGWHYPHYRIAAILLLHRNSGH